MDIENILSRLDGIRNTKDNQWQARCPAHEDSSPSLGISVKGNKIVMNCFAGCFKEDIVAAIGLEMHNLFIDEGYGMAASRKLPKPASQIDRDELDRTVLMIASSDIRSGKSLSIADRARVKIAKERLENYD